MAAPTTVQFCNEFPGSKYLLLYLRVPKVVELLTSYKGKIKFSMFPVVLKKSSFQTIM
jgi:hypothetical protein